MYLAASNGTVLETRNHDRFNSSSLTVSLDTVIPADGTYFIEVTGTATNPRATFTLNFSLTQLGCGYALVPALRRFEASGGTGDLNVTSGANCQWRAATDASWITLAATAAGTGSGTLRYTVASNTTNTLRRGTIQLDRQTHVIEQAGNGGSCSVVTTAIGQTVNGSLVQADCFSRLRTYAPDSTFYSDRYVFTGTAGQPVQFRVNSAGFAPHLYLFNAAGMVLAEAGGSLPSGASGDFYLLPTDGEYTLEVTTEYARAGGAYTLTLATPGGAANSCAYRITPEGGRFDAAGGSDTLSVTAGNGCAWAAQSNASWLRITEGAAGRGNGAVKFTVAANNTTVLRRAVVTIAGQEFAIQQAGDGGRCSSQALTVNQMVSGTLTNADCRARFPFTEGSDGGPSDLYSFNVQAGEQLQVLWLTPFASVSVVLADASGRVVLSNDPHGPSGPNRERLPGIGFFTLPTTGAYLLEVSGALTAYDLTVKSIAANCQYKLSANQFTFDSEASSGSFDVTVDAGCNWITETNVDWLTITAGQSGSGSGRVSFSLAANAAASARVARSITIAGQSVGLIQAGMNGNCLLRALPIGTTVNASFSQGDCAWPTSQGFSFLGDRYWFDFTEGQQFAVVTAGGTQQQPLNAYLTLTDETGAVLAESDSSGATLSGRLRQDGFIVLPRTGRYLITAYSRYGFTGDYTIRIERPTSCTYLLASPAGFFDSGISTGTMRVVSGSGCAWMATVNAAPWLTITQGASGTGNGTITYVAAANTAATLRLATISVAGQSFFVTQAGVGGNCATRPLALNQMVQGSLNQADCTASLGQNFNPQTMADRFSFTGKVGDRIAPLLITASPFLNSNLLDPSGRLRQLSINSIGEGEFFTLDQSGVYQLELAAPRFSDSPMVLDYRLAMRQMAAGCTYSISSSLQTLEAAGGTGSFNVSPSSGCAWTAGSTESWITLTTANGIGNGAVRFTVAPNHTNSARSGAIFLGDRQFAVAQSGSTVSCAATPLNAGQLASGSVSMADCQLPLYGVNRALARFPTHRYTFNGRAGERVSLLLWRSNSELNLYVVAPDGTSFADTNSPVFTLLRLPSSGSISLPADGVYQIYVAGGFNSNIVVDYQLLLTQTPAQCLYGLSANEQRFDSAGGNGSLQVLTTGECPWVATSNANWLTVTAPAAGAGRRAVNFSAAVNPASAARRAQILVGEQSFTVEQAGLDGNCLIQSLPLNQTVRGALRTSDCPTRLRFVEPQNRVSDRYSLVATANQQVRFTLTNDTGFNAQQLYLLDAAGHLIGQSVGLGAEGRLPESGFFALPGAGTYFVEIVGTSSDYRLTTSVTPLACAYVLASLKQTFNGRVANNPTANQTSSLSVQAATGCTWTAFSNADWLALAGASSNGQLAGSGNSTINFSVLPNNFQARSATITLADQTVTIEQSGIDGSCLPVTLTSGLTVEAQLNTSDCSFRLGSTTNYADQCVFAGRADERVQLTFAPLGGGGLLPTVTLTEPNGAVLVRETYSLSQPTTARLPDKGFVILPADGLYRVQFSAAQVARYFLTLNLQTACSFAVANSSFSFEAAGGQGSVPFQTATNCDWSVSSSVPWITTASRGNGGGTATFTVAPNPNAVTRTGVLSIGGTTITVTQLARTAVVSAASYNEAELASGAIVAAFGQGLAATTEVAQTNPLPTRLANVVVRVRDSANVTRDAPLFAVTPGQINFMIPAETALGQATVLIVNNNAIIATDEINMVAIAPALFAANADGRGVPAGLVLRVRNELQTYEPLARFDQASNRWVAVPIDLGPSSDEVFLVLFGTGFQRASLNATTTMTRAMLGGETAEVLYAGKQGGLVGLDQINLRVPRSLIGRGPANLFTTIGGKPANTLQVNIY